MSVHWPEMTRAERGKEQRRRKINGLCQLNTFINCTLSGIVQSLDGFLGFILLRGAKKSYFRLLLCELNRKTTSCSLYTHRCDGEQLLQKKKKGEKRNQWTFLSYATNAF